VFDPGLVISFINGLECEIPDPLEPHSSLIQSGLLDSLALFDLSVWIEEQVGQPIDPGEIDIAELWDSPRAIAHFIDATVTSAP
jgi:acyl carrier protein